MSKQENGVGKHSNYDVSSHFVDAKPDEVTIIQIVPIFNDRHELLLGLGDNNAVYRWDELDEYWVYHVDRFRQYKRRENHE